MEFPVYDFAPRYVDVIVHGIMADIPFLGKPVHVLYLEKIRNLTRNAPALGVG